MRERREYSNDPLRDKTFPLITELVGNKSDGEKVCHTAQVLSSIIEDNDIPSTDSPNALSLKRVVLSKTDSSLRALYALQIPHSMHLHGGSSVLFISHGEDPEDQSVRFFTPRITRGKSCDPFSQEAFEQAETAEHSSDMMRNLASIALAVHHDGIKKDPQEIALQADPQITLASLNTVPFSKTLLSQEHSPEQPIFSDPELGPFSDLLALNIAELAGHTDSSGNPVLGSLLREPFDNELRKTTFALSYYDGFNEGRDTIARHPAAAIQAARAFLTRNLVDLPGSTKSKLLFPPPNEFSLERGTPPLFSPSRLLTRGSLSVGQVDSEGNIPLSVEGEFTGIHIKPTDPDIHIRKVKRVRRREATIADLVDTFDDSKPSSREVHELIEDPHKHDFRPTFEITLTEQSPTGEEETYKVWRVNTGILVQCSTSDIPTFYRRDQLAKGNMQIYRKPVIYLYPENKMDITVQLDYAGKFTNTYPHIDGNKWRVTALPDGTLTTKGKQYKYLFWDGINNPVDWDFSQGFCVQSNDIDSFLEEKTQQFGLNFAEAQDFITYWAPMMKQNEWSLVSFQTEKYEELAKLLIDPKPDVLIRVFMVYKKINGKREIPAQIIEKTERKGFTVVEWGGLNLDEGQKESLFLSKL